MHGFEWHGKGEFDELRRDVDLAVTISYNGDYSGDAIINVVLSDYSAGYPANSIRVPCEALLEFAGRYLMSKKISAIEELSGREILDSL